ncbi:50S ribosomal protein L23, partial [Candidatus Microgenomates bacterium]
KAVEKKFKVNVLSVSTHIVKGKNRRVGARRAEVRLSNWKKAIVQVAKGQKIDLFDVAQS